MLNKKFDYKSLSRIEIDGSRRYKLNGSIDAPVPSVTTILSATKDTTELVKWRKRVGDAEANRITKESTNIGTLIHQHLENYVLGVKRPSGSNLIHTKATDYADVVINQGLSHVSEVWGTEVPLYYPNLYAGTTDCVGLWKGEESIVDFKSTKKPKKIEWIEDYFLQGAAYSMAHNLAYHTSIRTIVIMMIVWDGPEAGTYQEFVISGDKFDEYSVKWAERVDMYYQQIGSLT